MPATRIPAQRGTRGGRAAGASTASASQLSFDDLGTPLRSVTFAVIDVETTGMTPASAALTEVAAAMFRGGECLATFHSMVDPGMPVPARITELTGITDSMVRGAPSPQEVASDLRSAIGDAVIVGHNVRFDLAFLDAALEAGGAAPMRRPVVDTLALARRLLAGETTSFSLSALCSVLGLAHRPSHRSLDDVLATADLLHKLIELAGSYGATVLTDLLELPRVALHPHARKLALTANLPRRPGVYWFGSRTGSVLYVGSTTDLRARVRSYFSTDPRVKVPELLGRTESIGHVACSGALEARVVEHRLIRILAPPYNRRGRPTGRSAYLVVPRAEPEASRIARLPAGSAVGPVAGPLTGSVAGPLTGSVAAPFAGPVAGRVDTPSDAFERRVAEDAWQEAWIGPFPSRSAVEAILALLLDTDATGLIWPALLGRPEALVAVLQGRMRSLAREERFEEAEALRASSEGLLRSISHQVMAFKLWQAGSLLLRSGPELVELDRGTLVTPFEHAVQLLPAPVPRPAPSPRPVGPMSTHVAGEIALVASWMAANHATLEVLRSERTVEIPRPEPNPFAVRRRHLPFR